MANTYTQIYIQIVFGVYHRSPLIKKENKDELQKYISGIIINKKQKLLSINCMSDHSHLFIGIKPDICLSNLVRDMHLRIIFYTLFYIKISYNTVKNNI